MNKADLVSMIAAKSNLTKKDSESALNAFVETVQTALKKGEKIQLVGFGTFEVRNRAARTGVKVLDDGSKMRYCKKCNAELND